jgi:hypothetical protein
MNRFAGAGAVALALLAALASAPPAGAEAPAQAPTCADCCKLPCIEAQIMEAKQMRDFYSQLGKRKGMTDAEYETAESEAGQAASKRSAEALGQNASCAWYTPDGTDSIEMRKFQLARFRPVKDEAGTIVGWDYTMKANPKTCTINADAAELMPRIATCVGIAEATIAHEEKHQATCEATKGKTPTHAEMARDEVAAYDVEIAKLEALRTEAATACRQRSCAANEEAWKRSAENLGTDIEKLLDKGKKKPSRSPLARNRTRG